MKQLSDFKVGDFAKIVKYNDLEEILMCYPGDMDPMEVLPHSEKEVRICWLPKPEELDDWDGLIAVLLLDGSDQTLLLPIAVIEDIMPLGLVTEPVDDDLLPVPKGSPKLVRDVTAEHLMIEQLAAESIQNAFRYAYFLTCFKPHFVFSFCVSCDALLSFLHLDAMECARKQRSSRG